MLPNWVTQSGYFRLVTTVTLGMGITYGKILLCHDISKQSKNKAISTREYNDKPVNDCFDDPFPAGCGGKYLNLPLIPIDNSPRPNKRTRYISDPLPDAISITSGNSVSALTTPFDSPQVIVLNSDDPNTHHTIISDNPFLEGRKEDTAPGSMME